MDHDMKFAFQRRHEVLTRGSSRVCACCLCSVLVAWIRVEPCRHRLHGLHGQTCLLPGPLEKRFAGQPPI